MLAFDLPHLVILRLNCRKHKCINELTTSLQVSPLTCINCEMQLNEYNYSFCWKENISVISIFSCFARYRSQLNLIKQLNQRFHIVSILLFSRNHRVEFWLKACLIGRWERLLQRIKLILFPQWFKLLHHKNLRTWQLLIDVNYKISTKMKKERNMASFRASFSGFVFF